MHHEYVYDDGTRSPVRVRVHKYGCVFQQGHHVIVFDQHRFKDFIQMLADVCEEEGEADHAPVRLSVCERPPA